MQLVEKHVINQNHPDFAEIDAATFAAKNLYNLATYHQRQRYFAGEYVYSYIDLHKLLKGEDAYQALPRKVSQQVLRMVDKSWKGYFASLKAWQKEPSKFLGKPKLPKYKDKESGRYTLVYTIQAISAKLLRIGQIKPSGLRLIVKTKQTDIAQVRIVPQKTHYVVEVVYKVEPEPAELDYTLIAGIDLGLDNLAVVSSNKQGFMPLVVNGKPLKSINQFYNKRKAELQSILGSDKVQSKRIDRMTDKRNRRIDHYLHTAYQIIKKVAPAAFSQGVEDVVVHPSPLPVA